MRGPACCEQVGPRAIQTFDTRKDLPMSIPSEYVLYHTLSNLGYPPLAVSLAVDVLQGRHDDDQADEDGPESWPEWTDEDRWEPTPEAYEPEPEDEEWVAGLPTDEDLEDMARHAAWLDHMEGLARITD